MNDYQLVAARWRTGWGRIAWAYGSSSTWKVKFPLSVKQPNIKQEAGHMNLKLRRKVWTRVSNLKVTHRKMGSLQRTMSQSERGWRWRRGPSGEPCGTPTFQVRPRWRSQQRRQRKNSQARKKANRKRSPHSQAKSVSAKRSRWMKTLDVAPWRLLVILTSAFLASYIFLPTLPNFH